MNEWIYLFIYHHGNNLFIYYYYYYYYINLFNIIIISLLFILVSPWKSFIMMMMMVIIIIIIIIWCYHENICIYVFIYLFIQYLPYYNIFKCIIYLSLLLFCFDMAIAQFCCHLTHLFFSELFLWFMAHCSFCWLLQGFGRCVCKPPAFSPHVGGWI